PHRRGPGPTGSGPRRRCALPRRRRRRRRCGDRRRRGRLVRRGGTRSALAARGRLRLGDPGLRGDAAADPGGPGAAALAGMDAALALPCRSGRRPRRGGAALLGPARVPAARAAAAGVCAGHRARSRRGRAAWAILVSEVMLRQTPVVRVLPRWQEWMRRWPSPADLADAPPAEVVRCGDRLGYPRRARRLQECARAIVRDHGGRVPHGQEALRALPGIGEYTAAAVTAFAHHGRAVVVDTNIRRVLARSVRGRALPDRTYSAAERA